MLMKRWESPRKQGRNDKDHGSGGSARARQKRKQLKGVINVLKAKA
jgi:hypothetical protein